MKTTTLIIISLLTAGLAFGESQQKPSKRPLPGKEPIKEVSKPQDRKPFPEHWGRPPEIQTKDIRPLPGKFGLGSSTLAKWIADNLKRDASKEQPEKKPNPKPRPPKPKPPVDPISPIVPLPPAEIKNKIDLYRMGQKRMQDGLKARISELGKNPSREEVREAVEDYKKNNKQLIEWQKELGETINEWHKDNKPTRASRPEPSVEIKAKLTTVKEKQRELDIIRKAFHEKLKDSKELTKDQRTELVKEFKEANADKHRAVKEAQKELQKEIRGTQQDGPRRK